MTGFGNSSVDHQGLHVTAEIKSVNNRYLKLSVRLPDAAARFESDVERLIRSKVSRGTVQLSVRIRFPVGQSEHRIDENVLRNYQLQLSAMVNHSVSGAGEVSLRDLLALPGVVTDNELPEDVVNAVWPAVEMAINGALEHFDDFRQREGISMQADLSRQCEAIEDQLRQVSESASQVVIDYRDRLLERVRRLISETPAKIDDNDVIREVALFADKCDINEEMTRLRSHIEQFRRFLSGETSQGRKLEFIGQEMFREINTIGSKANQVSVAHSVVEMKAAIERIREVLQNVE